MDEDKDLLAVVERRCDDPARGIDEARTESRQRFDRLDGELRQPPARRSSS